jgi:radical SAM superfamily enzyme YgiQ (UPF0313 family)
MWARPLGILKVAQLLSTCDLDLHLIDCMDSYRPRRYNMGKYPKELLPTPALLKGIKRRYSRYGIPVDDFVRKMKDILPVDAILVTCIMTYWYPGARDVIGICREIAGSVPVVLGGIYATLYPEHAGESSGADILFKGRADGKLMDLLRTVGLKIEQVGSPRPYYKLGFYRSMPYAPVYTSSGCPFRCTYCASSILWGGFVERETVEVVKEIKELHAMGVRDFAFYDDALLYRRESHIKRILYRIVKDDLQARFHTPNGLHARYIDQEIASLMYKAGFRTLRLSLETVNPERQNNSGAKVFNTELEGAVKTLKKAGFSKNEIGVYLMYGLPGQDINEVWQGVRFLKGLGVKIYLAEFSPIPGTAEWTRLIESGIITEDIDPLLTNNSVFPLLFSGYDEGEIKLLKDHVVKYNLS